MTRTEESKALVHRLVEIVNDRETEALEEVATGDLARRAGDWIGPFLDAFPDFRMEVVEIVAEADKVVGCFRCSGTHEGEWRGVPPSGRRFEGVDEIYVFRVQDGRLSSVIVAVEDNLARMRQLGIRP